MEAEGLKRRKFWTFNIVDGRGVSLIRLSTEVEKEYLGWMEVLGHAGCMPRVSAAAAGIGGGDN